MEIGGRIDMKNVKLIIFGIIIALLVVFAFQNQENYFQKKNHLKLDLIVAGPYQTADHPTAPGCSRLSPVQGRAVHCRS